MMKTKARTLYCSLSIGQKVGREGGGLYGDLGGRREKGGFRLDGLVEEEVEGGVKERWSSTVEGYREE